MANHEKKFPQPNPYQVTLLRKIEQDARVGLWEERKKHLRELYQVNDSELNVLETMATLETPDWTTTYDGQEHHLLEGHTWLRKASGVDFESLQNRGLLERPRVDGEPRQRIYHREYWNLTSEARDLIDTTKVGSGIGDLNESVVHSLGVALTSLYAKYIAEENANTTYSLDAYAPDESVVYDLLTRDADTGEVLASAEVETTVPEYSRLRTEAVKLAYQPGLSLWVAPNRDVLVRIMNTLRNMGILTLSRPLPRTLALMSSDSVRGIRERIQTAADNDETENEYVTDVATYAFLADELKEVRPEFFYTNSKSTSVIQ
ncbi:hypothetical protein KTS45_11095 [Halomicroarcula limicola]|uniref:Uncharacterized protein n=1 Tax=Haloarcula limicola TaxID=1429915 RepID=A0A8J8C8N1_9EURY|nr:hypothetical protein [Halomicroarcula limicola]MBV0924745.1 hypothetical protein [Halomicroarcula limicola]